MLATICVATASLLTSNPPPTTVTLQLQPLQPGDGAGSSVVHWEGHAWRVVAEDWSQARRLGEDECGESHLRPGDPQFFFSLGMSVFMVVLAGLMAGCTMGLLSLDALTLKLKALEGSAAERSYANAILPVLSNHHRLLVSLLLCNAAANEALPIFLDTIVDAQTAVLISVTCVLLFGEILPSAVMTGPHQLAIGAALAPFVRALMLITAPISWPIAKLLDVVLGHHGGMTRFKRNEFKAIIKMQTVRNTKSKINVEKFQSLVSTAVSNNRASTVGSSAGATSAPVLPSFVRQNSTGTNAANSLRNVLAEQKSGMSGRLETPGTTATASGGHERVKFAESVEVTGGSGRSDSGRWGDGRLPSPTASEADTTVARSSVRLGDDEFSDDEVTILHGVLNLQTKCTRALLDQAYNSFANLHMVSFDEKMNYETMDMLIRWGHSRVPVYRGRRNNIVGLLLIKEHLLLDPDDETPIAELHMRKPALAHPESSVFALLNTFQTGKSHMALVTEDIGTIEACWRNGEDVPEHVTIQGVCTIEDVVEEIIGEEIMDETDYAENAAAPPPLLPVRSTSAVAIAPRSEAELSASYGPSDPLLGEGSNNSGGRAMPLPPDELRFGETL